MRNNYGVNHVMNREGVYYYIRRVPCDLSDFYTIKRLCFSLKTKSLNTAKRLSRSIEQKLEDYWLGLRLQNLDIPQIKVSSKPSDTLDQDGVSLSDALELYLKLKGQGKDQVFFRTAKRNIRYVTNLLGDKPLSAYSSKEAGQFRDWLLEQGMGVNTVKRVFSTIRSIINICITEMGLECSNAFSKTFMPSVSNSEGRQPIPQKNIERIKAECHRLDDDMRWLVALLCDSGLRLGEATGLAKDDLVLDHSIPHIKVKPHPWRSLKTVGSEREVPLIGISLWAAKRIKNNGSPFKFAFPRYTNDHFSNANSASAALNKWLKPFVPENCVIHSFRHSFRDRLRNVECPFDIIDRLGGWITSGIGQTYGKGYDLNVLSKWMLKVDSNILNKIE